MRYATTNNFTGNILYSEARAFLTAPAAAAVVRASRTARTEGYGLTIFDAYRPWRVTKKLWDSEAFVRMWQPHFSPSRQFTRKR